MAFCINVIPSERLRVFISSAQNNENGTAWSDVRRRIKASLQQCIYLNPFIIEDEASVMPSTQLYQRQVEKSDVVVLLVKGEVRYGTATEYSLSAMLKKPLLIYFIDDENPNLDVVKLKMEIETTDRCTYQQVSSFDDIEITIRNDIMNNVIRIFQDRFSVSRIDNDSFISTAIHEETKIITAGIPSKTTINKFDSCYQYFFNLLSIGKHANDATQSELHKFGSALLSWLVHGEWKISAEDIIDFISQCSDGFDNVNWLQKRWDAIRSFNRGDLRKALEDEERALVLAREAEESDWIINNILIDCRNIEIAISNQNRIFLFDSKYQNELSMQNAMVYIPVTDRYLNDIYEQIEKDEFREETATPYTTLYGSGLSLVLADLANYLFTSAVYGSHTHLLHTRRVFARILSRYSKIHDDSSLAFLSLKQYVLSESTKDFKAYLDSSWNKLYSFITSQADAIWRLTDFAPVISKASMKLSVFASLGLYFSDAVFADASEYILIYSDCVFWDNSEAFFEALYTNLDRMNAEQVLLAITPIIQNRRFNLGSILSKIIFRIDLNQVSEPILQQFANALKVQLPFIISNNGDPQIIAPLVERSVQIFGDLENVEGNGLVGVQALIYKINRGAGNMYPFLKTEIESARMQFIENNMKGVYHEFASNPYSRISTIVRKEKDNSEIISLIISDFIPLSINVINSEAAVQTKESCVACLCEVLITLIEQGVDLPNSIKEALKAVDIEKGTDFLFSSNRKTLEIRVLMAQIIAGIVDEKSLFQWCIEFGTLEIKEKIAIIDCLEKYLYHKKANLYEVDALVVSIVLQCHSERHRDIRKIAVRCLAYLVSSKYHDIVTAELTKSAFDSSDHVRIALLKVCKDNLLPDETAHNIMSLLHNDANFRIRNSAKVIDEHVQI